MTRLPLFALLTTIGLATSGTALPAMAGDVQGDAYDCNELWEMRNKIFKDNGYCFTSARAINYFGNENCDYHSESAVPFSKPERRMIRDIRASERRLSCGS